MDYVWLGGCLSPTGPGWYLSSVLQLYGYTASGQGLFFTPMVLCAYFTGPLNNQNEEKAIHIAENNVIHTYSTESLPSLVSGLCNTTILTQAIFCDK
jgi:hypothetical protein